MEGGVDPYKILEVPKNFDVEMLKQQYKRIAVRVHPDKGGSEYMFNLVTDCFRHLMKEYKTRTSDRQFFELKGGYEKQRQKYSTRNTANSFYMDDSSMDPNNDNRNDRKNDWEGPGKNFDIGKFNALFDKHRIENVHDRGYNDWYKKDIPEKDVPDFKGSGKEAFNRHFEKHVKVRNDSKHVVKYVEPEAMWSTKIPCTEIGTISIDDYSGDNSTLKRLNYTDLKLAHSTTRIVDPSLVNRKEYKSVDDLKRDRGNVQFEMDEKEMREYLRRTRAKEEAEKKRMMNVQQLDTMYEKHHNKMHNLLQQTMQ